MPWLVWIGIAVVAEVIEQLLNRLYLSKTPQYWEFLVGYSFGAILLSLILLCGDMQLSGDMQFMQASAATVLVLLVSGVLWFFLSAAGRPLSVEDNGAAFVVKDGSGQQLAYVYFEDEPGRRGLRHLPPNIARPRSIFF